MHDTSDTRGPPPLLIAALAGLACLGLIECARVHCRRMKDPVALPERLQTWEAEGGQNQMERRPPGEL